MCVCVRRVCRPNQTTAACVRTVSQYGERTDHSCMFCKTYTVGVVRIEYTGVSCENVWNHCVYTSSSTPIARANACTHARRMDAMGLMRAFVCRRRARRRTRETREPRRSTSIASNVSLLPVSLASRSIDSTDEFIAFHSFIHSVATEGTREGRNDPRDDATDEGRDRRETRDPRRETRPFASRAEREVRASRTHDASNRAFIACMHFKPPTGDDRARIAMNAMKRAKRSSD